MVLDPGADLLHPGGERRRGNGFLPQGPGRRWSPACAGRWMATQGPRRSMARQGPRRSMARQGPRRAMATQGPRRSMATQGPRRSMATQGPRRSMAEQGPRRATSQPVTSESQPVTSESAAHRSPRVGGFPSPELSELKRGQSQRREGDSNPRTGLGPLHDFQSCPFNHSGTSPRIPPSVAGVRLRPARRRRAAAQPPCRRRSAHPQRPRRHRS